MKSLYYTKEEAMTAAINAGYSKEDIKCAMSSADVCNLELEGKKANDRLQNCDGEVSCYRFEDDIFAWWVDEDDETEEEAEEAAEQARKEAEDAAQRIWNMKHGRR